MSSYFIGLQPLYNIHYKHNQLEICEMHVPNQPMMSFKEMYRELNLKNILKSIRAIRLTFSP